MNKNQLSSWVLCKLSNKAGNNEIDEEEELGIKEEQSHENRSSGCKDSDPPETSFENEDDE
jgi:hypothetical protein